MSHDYKGVTWTPFKKTFDRWMLIGIALYLVFFIVFSFMSQPPGESITPIQTLLRATGTLAFGLLTIILMVGPLARISDRFKPFLYNRRHLGVTTFLIGLVHAALVLMWYHGFGDLNPFVSLFVSNPNYESLSGFPFESLGFVALLILFLMASTSHDFWNANLGPGLWKTIHMGVYLAYGLLVLHITLGAIQFEKSPIYIVLLVTSFGIVGLLHLGTALATLKPARKSDKDGWLEVGLVQEFVSNQARIVRPAEGEAIAVFLHGELIYAVSNVCRHQGGPLGEGRIIGECITCPWHGFQYRLEDGRSPDPFTEKIATYATRIINSTVFVNQKPNEPGTAQAPSIVGDMS